MKLNKNGQLARLYRFTFGGTNLPYDFCIFFWKIIFAGLIFPFAWISYPAKADGFGERIICSAFGWFLIFVAAVTVIFIYESPFDFFKVIGYLIGGIVLFIVLFIVLILVFALLSKSKDTEIIRMISEKKKAVKDNYCPQIDWK